ncbi:MAG: hypothetical protein QM770_11990 [Tepidisphaeraceae bacterium]
MFGRLKYLVTLTIALGLPVLSAMTSNYVANAYARLGVALPDMPPRVAAARPTPPATCSGLVSQVDVEEACEGGQ